MKRRWTSVLCATLLALLVSCDKNDQERARERAAEARQKVRNEAHKLGTEAKREAKNLDSNVHRALQGGSGEDASTGAQEKLDHAGSKLRAASNEAGAKLAHAAIIAKIKAKLAADAGLSAATDIKVDEAGGTVTLSGTVSSDEQKREAANSAAQINGVTKVVNNLTVEP